MGNPLPAHRQHNTLQYEIAFYNAKQFNPHSLENFLVPFFAVA
jgi:hypothetical protein